MADIQKKSEFEGGNISAFAAQFLDPSATNQHIVRASVNPLIFGISKTVMDLVFSKPFPIKIWDIKSNEVDDEKTNLIRANFKKINITQKTRVAANDALLFGNGMAEFAWDQDPESHYIMFSSVQRLPPENFAKKLESPASSALRWKGIYYTETGDKGFDEAVKTEKGTEIRTLNPDQVMCIPSISEIAPDGPGFLEYLMPALQGSKFAWAKCFDVMDTQITPVEITTDNSVEGPPIAKNYTEHHNGTDIVPRPSWVKVERPTFPNKLDVLEFYKFFQNFMSWIIFPTAALNYDGANALLDPSSGAEKTTLLFSFINTLRANVATELEKKVELWLKLNGFEGKYSAEVSAPSTIPKDYQESVAIATLLSRGGAWTVDEMREWANQFSGFDLDVLETGGDVLVAMAAEPVSDDHSKARVDALVTALLGESFQDATEKFLDPLLAKIEKAGI